MSTDELLRISSGNELHDFGAHTAHILSLKHSTE